MGLKENKETPVCYDCGKLLEIKGEEIINGKFLVYETKDEKVGIYKCNNCYKKDPSLKDYQECEVYSRIVGYIRPIKQWNPGKQGEYSDRKVFKEK